MLAIAALLVCMQTGVFLSLGSWFQRWYGEEEVPQVKEIRPIDEHGRVARIGRLGDKAIAIPGSVYLGGWVRYMGDPNDFDFSKEANHHHLKQHHLS